MKLKPKMPPKWVIPKLDPDITLEAFQEVMKVWEEECNKMFQIPPEKWKPISPGTREIMDAKMRFPWMFKD